MAEGGGGEVVLMDLEEVKEEEKKDEVVRKESGGKFTLGAEDGDELLGEMEFTIRHTQATPYKVGTKTVPNRYSNIDSRRILPQSLHFCQTKLTGQAPPLQATGPVSHQV